MDTGQEHVVALMNMDCFFVVGVHVEQQQNSHLRNKLCAVVQYKSWKRGGIIAVSYEAQLFGADDAKKLCPGLLLAQVHESRGKANLAKYREASAEVMEVMSCFAAYVDLTSAVQERLQKLQGRPISADFLPSTYNEGCPQGPTTAEETVQKRYSIASYSFCFLPLEPALKLILQPE
uniref:UmuC domain-containing protein n=1 Tax=Cebus imitator TaxID=2715852 RepID=A0A2K5PNW4_CEBIM